MSFSYQQNNTIISNVKNKNLYKLQCLILRSILNVEALTR